MNILKTSSIHKVIADSALKSCSKRFPDFSLFSFRKYYFISTFCLKFIAIERTNNSKHTHTHIHMNKLWEGERNSVVGVTNIILLHRLTTRLKLQTNKYQSNSTNPLTIALFVITQNILMFYVNIMHDIFILTHILLP